MAKRHQSVRIIAGEWRGRLLPVLAKDGLRPSKDMVRETLFNWLQQKLYGKRCLDAFAGTGALGFEAASRGAADVVLVEQDRQVAQHLQGLLTEDTCYQRLQVVNQSVLHFLPQAQAFDIIFLDPPFQLDLWSPCLQMIVEHSLLTKNGFIYIEAAKQAGLPTLPAAMRYIKQKHSGQVVFALARWNDTDR